MDKKDIQKIIDKYQSKGTEIKLRDIAFAILSNFIPEEYSYAVTFSPVATTQEVAKYKDLDYIKNLRKDISTKINSAPKKKHDANFKGVTFEENREELINLLNELQDAKIKGKIDAKDAIKIEADIRTKLNDKFGASEKVETNHVIVNTKFNHICDWTHKECFLQTKEYAMSQWNLVDYDDIKSKYDLIPKKVVR